MIDGMAFWRLVFLASSFTVSAMVIPRVQAGGQRRSVQTEAPINWNIDPLLFYCSPFDWGARRRESL